MWWCNFWILRFCFFQFWLNKTFLLNWRCNAASLIWLALKLFLGLMCWPSEVVMSLVTPKSIPMALVEGWIGFWSSARSHPKDTYQCPDFLLIVMFLMVPMMSCDFLNFTKPTPLGSLTRLPSTRQYLSNWTKRIESQPSDLRLKRGISGRSGISIPLASLKNLGLRGFFLFSLSLAWTLGSKKRDQAEARSRTFCCKDTALAWVLKKSKSGLFFRSMILLTKLVALINSFLANISNEIASIWFQTKRAEPTRLFRIICCSALGSSLNLYALLIFITATNFVW